MKMPVKGLHSQGEDNIIPAVLTGFISICQLYTFLHTLNFKLSGSWVTPASSC